jgi:hypothetical protein
MHPPEESTRLAQFYECDVFDGAGLRVLWGINEGDGLGPPDSLCLGDIFALAAQARPLRLRLEIDTGQTRLATCPPELGLQPGSIVQICGELRFMSPDSEVVAAVLLACNDRHLLLPLNPMRPGMGYCLITLDNAVTALRMAELVQGCFATGVRVAMADGSLCKVEALAPGMQLRTRDHGPQTLRWIGQSTQRAHGIFAPVTFAPGTLGNLGPLTLGPLQRIFLYQRGETLMGTRPEILVQAQSLVDGTNVLQRQGGFVTYYSLVFDEHQIIYAEGIPAESMLVSRATVERLPDALAQDLAQRFPHLNQKAHFAQDMPLAQMTDDIRSALLRQGKR